MNLLAGCSVRIEPLVFERYIERLSAQILPPHINLDLLFIDDSATDEHSEGIRRIAAAHGAEIWPATPRPPAAHFAASGRTHDWSVEAIDHLARNKQRLLDHAAEHYDGFFLLDADLLIEPTTLASLLSVEKAIVSAAFWTQWQKGDPGSLGPNVWLRHPYGQAGLWKTSAQFWDGLARRKVQKVLGGGAAMLVRSEVLDRVRYHPRLDGLPEGGMWQGEDRTFALLAERHHLPQYVDAWPDIVHCYHPEQREPAYLAEVCELLAAPRQRRAKYGDLVNFTAQALDDADLAGETFSVRGRLGGLDVLPEIEAALAAMAPGTERLVEIRFPQTWPIERLHDERRHIRLKLIDVKEYGYAPILAESEMFRGVEANG